MLNQSCYILHTPIRILVSFPDLSKRSEYETKCAILLCWFVVLIFTSLSSSRLETEVNKWASQNDIVILAKDMCMMMMDMSDFTRCVCVCVCVCVRACACRVLVCACVRVLVCVCMCVGVCMHVCGIHACTCVYWLGQIC